jgi:hypothetical protein
MKKLILPVIFGIISLLAVPIFGLVILLGSDGVGDDTRGISIILLVLICTITITYSLIVNGVGKLVAIRRSNEYNFLVGSLITWFISSIVYVLLVGFIVIGQTIDRL